ncbi:unnamed protein product [Gadus morhua 'NCC']
MPVSVSSSRTHGPQLCPPRSGASHLPRRTPCGQPRPAGSYPGVPGVKPGPPAHPGGNRGEPDTKRTNLWLLNAEISIFDTPRTSTWAVSLRPSRTPLPPSPSPPLPSPPGVQASVSGGPERPEGPEGTVLNKDTTNDQEEEGFLLLPELERGSVGGRVSGSV